MGSGSKGSSGSSPESGPNAGAGYQGGPPPGATYQ
jgi:hypothetical protein